MRILLGNTGRGGELAIFTAFVQAYKTACPDAYIEVMTADNGIYGPLFEHDPGITWTPLDFRDTTKPYYKDPVRCWRTHAKRRTGFDIVEFVCEFGCSRANTTFSNLYNSIENKLFTKADVKRQVMIYPTQDELDWANWLHDDCPLMVVISHICKSATKVFKQEDYQALADALLKDGYRTAYVGGPQDPPIMGHMDLRGITFSAFYALTKRLKWFIGPDTATTWIASGMSGKLVSLRGCHTYPLHNTGIVANGFKTNNILEYDVVHKPTQEVIQNVQKFLQPILNR